MTEETIGARIKRLRRQRGLTNEQLSDMAGISRSRLSHYELERHEPSPSIIPVLADALGVSVRYFLTGQGAENQKRIIATRIPNAGPHEMLGERIRRLREQIGISQRELARRAGVHEGDCSRWESQQNAVMFDVLPNLAKALEVSIDYLVTGRESPRVAALHRAILMSPGVDAKIVAMVRGQ